MKLSYFAVANLAALSFSQGANALVWNETDAGDMLGTAEIIGAGASPLTGITGFLTSTVFVGGDIVYQVDLFRIAITDHANFSARANAGVEDTALFLFDASGYGIYSNDDNSAGLSAVLPAGGVSSNGLYYLGVAKGGTFAQDVNGTDLFLPTFVLDSVQSGNPASGPLDSWHNSYSFSTETAVSYSVALTGVSAVPEPGAALLLGLGLAGIAVARRRGA